LKEIKANYKKETIKSINNFIEKMTENEISYLIRGAIYEVYNTLGAGLLESVYVHALEFELREKGLYVQREVPLPVHYKNIKMDLGYRLDLLVNEKVIIEVKSVENLAEVHHKQVLTYLKLTNLKLGILVNFNVAQINEGIFRKVNGL
jgi:GxxExxY protein